MKKLIFLTVLSLLLINTTIPVGAAEKNVLLSQGKPVTAYAGDVVTSGVGGFEASNWVNGYLGDTGYITNSSGNYYGKIDLLGKAKIINVGFICKPSSWGGTVSDCDKLQVRGTNDKNAAFDEMTLLGETSFNASNLPNDTSVINWWLYPSEPLDPGEYRYISIGRPSGSGYNKAFLVEVEVWGVELPSDAGVSDALLSRGKPVSVFADDIATAGNSTYKPSNFVNGYIWDAGYIENNPGNHYLKIDLLNKAEITNVGFICRPSSWGGTVSDCDRVQIRGTNDKDASFDEMTLLGETSFTAANLPNDNTVVNWWLYPRTSETRGEYRYISIGRPANTGLSHIFLVQIEVWGKAEDDLGAWSCTASGANKTVSVTVKNNRLSESADYMIVAASYNADGVLTEINTAKDSIAALSSKTLSCDISPPAGSTEISVILIHSFTDMQMLSDAFRQGI